MPGFVRQIVFPAAIIVVLIAGLSIGLYYTLPSLGGNSTTTNQSFQAGNQSIISNSLSSSTTSTEITTIGGSSSALSTSTDSSFSTLSTSSAQGAFTYSPSSPLKVLSVQAFVNENSSGNNKSLSLSVTFQNIGNSTIYVVSGGASGLNATILSGPARAEQTNLVRCEIAAAIVPLSAGNVSTAFTPGCWSQYTYLLLQPGTISVQLTLNWSTSSFPAQGQKSATVTTAQFDLS